METFREMSFYDIDRLCHNFGLMQVKDVRGYIIPNENCLVYRRQTNKVSIAIFRKLGNGSYIYSKDYSNLEGKIIDFLKKRECHFIDDITKLEKENQKLKQEIKELEMLYGIN